MKRKQYDIYTDGSYRPDCYGSWCAILVEKGTPPKETTLKEHVFDTTIGRMELTPIVVSLESLKEPCDVVVYSDSQYAINCISKWIGLWRQCNYKNLRGEPIKNLDLIERIYLQMVRHRIKAKWIRGHNGHVYNERCNKIAQDLTLKMKLGIIKRKI